MFGIRQGVAGIGENGVQRHAPAHGVVAVPEVATVGVDGDHRYGPIGPNLPHQLLSELGAVLQALVWEAQEHYFCDAQDRGRLALFLFTDPRQVCRLDVAIARPFIAVCANYQDDLASLLRPSSNGATRSAFGVIRMWGNHQNRGHLLHQCLLLSALLGCDKTYSSIVPLPALAGKSLILSQSIHRVCAQSARSIWRFSP